MENNTTSGVNNSSTTNSSTTNSPTTNSDEQQSQQSDPHTRFIILIICWIFIIVGVIGNSLVIGVVKLIRSMHTTTNYLLLNVASADITTLLSIAIQLITSMHLSRFSSFLCKFVSNGNVSIVTLIVSSYTFTLLAIERYYALVKPMTASRRLRNDNVAYVILGIWLVAVGLVTPLFVVVDANSHGGCDLGASDNKMLIYVYCLFTISIIIPFIIIATCYLRVIYGMHFKKTICSNQSERVDTRQEITEKHRLVKVLILLTAVFFTAFIPYSFLLIMDFSNIYSSDVINLQYSAQFLTLLSCSVNPFIYAFQSSNYRRGYALVFKKLFCRDKSVNAIELRQVCTNSSLRIA